MRKLTLLFTASLIGLAGLGPASAQDLLPSQNVGKVQSPPTAAALSGGAEATPMVRRLSRLPAATFSSAAPPASTGTPAVMGGTNITSFGGGPRIALPAERAPSNYGNNPFGGGGTNLNTIYHYTDKLVDLDLLDNFPIRAIGHFAFVNSGGSFRCTAALIAPSILVTAGHCLHDGGNGAAGYNTSGYFVPVRNPGSQPSGPYGYATANWIIVTSGWYNTGSLDGGYDVGIVVLNKRAGTTTEIGRYTGWFGFCYLNCLQPYWYLTQYGYPGNYYSGLYLYEGQHLETNRTNHDYYHGSGAQGGSSGGPHVANVGSISDSSANKGNYQGRNIIFAVTSWGYISDIYKIQGASPLSGPGNINNIKAYYNAACNRSRTIHGTSSCNLLP
jgi:V8-like Glu-specific endopeptidase